MNADEQIAQEVLAMTDQEFEEQLILVIPLLKRLAAQRLVCPFDRSDAVQECCCRAWKYRSRLYNDAKFRCWISRILINECHRVIRARYSEKYVLIGQDALNQIESTNAHEEIDELRAAVHALPESLKTAVKLSLRGYRIYEIAQILCVSPSAVKSRLYRARSALRIMM